MGNVVAELENRILRLEERNKRVEVDKSWETSWTRKCLLIIFTYLAIAFYFPSFPLSEIKNENVDIATI